MSVAGHFVNARDPKTLTVRQVMENAVYTVSPDIKVIAIAETMSNENFGAVPIVEKISRSSVLCPNSTCYESWRRRKTFVKSQRKRS